MYHKQYAEGVKVVLCHNELFQTIVGLWPQLFTNHQTRQNTIVPPSVQILWFFLSSGSAKNYCILYWDPQKVALSCFIHVF